MASVPPPNPYYDELRMRERIANRGQTTQKFSRKSAIVGLVIVLVAVVGGLVLLYAPH